MAALDAQRVEVSQSQSQQSQAALESSDDARRSAEEASASARALAGDAVESARSYKRNVDDFCFEYARAPSEPLQALALAKLAHWATKQASGAGFARCASVAR